VVPRSSDSQHRLRTGVRFDVINLDGETAIAAPEEARVEGNGCEARWSRPEGGLTSRPGNQTRQSSRKINANMRNGATVRLPTGCHRRYRRGNRAAEQDQCRDSAERRGDGDGCSGGNAPALVHQARTVVATGLIALTAVEDIGPAA
jgi:hypothetical protein